MEKTSGIYSVFKGTGAAKFSIMHPTRSEPRQLRDSRMAEGFITKNGGVLLEAAPAVGKRDDGLPLYDWKQKITFGIGVQDITQLLDPKTQKLIHKKNDLIKTLSFQPGTGNHAGTYKLFLNEGSRKVFVPLTAGEFTALQRLLVGVLPKLIGW
jgi:hypothetical protein